MKKTLIVLALAAASGSAMAWTVSGSGGDFDLGGSLNPVEKVTPWEVKVGDALTGLDADIQKGQKTVNVNVRTAIPVLGIRTKENTAFRGQPGITPQIGFDNAVDIETFTGGVTTLTLAVKGGDSAEIGTMKVPFSAAAVVSVKRVDVKNCSQFNLYADESGGAFFGGLPKSLDSVSKQPEMLAKAILTNIANNFDSQNSTVIEGTRSISFSSGAATFSAYYASGIEAGKEIKIALNSPVSADAPLKWKASLPVIVTCM
ncbi:F4 family fimbrial subunit [Erwinia tasmaniensis]|uniref:K88 fimbrial protein AC n=1 Tax=Erwinia tasmaniensis (strain DSM 17950 / CFBP 7177 / CIP 109463 / NCPPB 4357 / Et1/99) TaxID=465817 RepID=B2VI82_ERWT9|nr:fimbrial protein [Erwinia tasmaniensis]CAO95210.1 K88 fimbrial protein AC precursor [Erwinia tasmaniensis Et1/99]